MTPEEAYRFCRENGRKAKLEKIIIKDPIYAYHYALTIIKGRWIEAEPYIIKDSYCAYAYATKIVKGKLPENMHNMMLLHGLDGDSSARLAAGRWRKAEYWAKRYLDFIKNKP
jgi:hypothetical protein